MKNFKVGSLFAGVGGICKGFEKAFTENSSYELIWANEIDAYASATYKNNFKHTLLEGDIELILNPEILLERGEQEEFYKYQNLKKKILEKPVDVLNGGFPCQAFSIAGERKGFSDTRGNLFLSIVNLINQLGTRHYKPRVLFLENVKNLQSHDKGRTYKVIKSELENSGYKIYERVLNTMYYSDLPQNRERIYIIGFLENEDAEKFNLFEDNILFKYRKEKSKEEREMDVKRIIDYNMTKEGNEKYYYTREKYPNYFMTQKEFEESNKKVKIDLAEEINEMYQFYQCRRGMYVRKNQSNVCPTLTANMGTGGHNVPLIKVSDGIRKLTTKETFKLQGFSVDEDYFLPERFKNRVYPDSQLYKQAGNAVSIPVIEFLARKILDIIE